ncbi:hypothetical protein E1B28_010696 [Marasmius oreades]|uniref:Major facilitator superfamily (MFS) profile domain-containing protein n=1 Tax=Marasmius oreades TaxID=181124 RepID=A0A9P7RXP8_9AGAR|nr:uncharacterized protein E1B28_010696 [Marasmius oreades]KAG7091676.1 hypothetical protein E1B28_010696 [Marasmius oreades]
MSTSMSTASSSSPTKTESSNLQDPRLISVSELDKVFDIQNDFRAIRDSIHTIDSFMVTEPENSHRPAPARRLFYWKMDFYVLPVLGMMLALVALDQTTFRAFRLSGIEDKLSLSDKQYKMSLTLTYIPFVVSPYPLNLMLRRLGPNYVLPGIIVLCGVIILSTGFVKSYEALLACRFLLGLFEGGLLPGIAIHLTSLYPRHKLAFR